MLDPGIVRNRVKIESTIDNAKAVRAVQKELGSLDAYLWSFVDGDDDREPRTATRRRSRAQTDDLRRR